MRDNKVFIHAFGCQMNKLDAELALSALRRAGYEEAATPEEADVVLYNTCSVRAHAEERVYSNVGKLKSLKQRKPRLIIGILGCMAQKDREKIFERLPHVDLVCGTREFPRIAELIEEARRLFSARRSSGAAKSGADRVLACSEDVPVSEAHDITVRPNRRQAFLGIMRGCDNYCAYCVVPYVRGREISRPMEEIVDEAKRLADDGCREITLLGQNVNSYGKSSAPATTLKAVPPPRSLADPPPRALADPPPRSLADPSPCSLADPLSHNSHNSHASHNSHPLPPTAGLAELLTRLDKIPGLLRVRFVTSHPKDMSREILEAVRDLPTVCEHLHMPAQSGSDRVLAAMNRKYTARGYRDLVALARELVPGIAIASDFIVGFPGETEAEFDETAALVRDLRFQNSFVFKYSPRPGTAAAALADDVSWEEKRRRNTALLEIQSAINAEENRKFIGQVVEVFVEGPSHRDAARLTGRLRTNQIVVFAGPSAALRTSPAALAGELVKVRVESATPLTLAGTMTTPSNPPGEGQL